jgi:tRNA-2-methylthio-N6-dimethylallyladenosine synthase
LRIYIETYGCQMNDYDSRMVTSMLAAAGHASETDPRRADAVIVNTCSVRERAEDRVLGRLRQLTGLMKPDAVLGVIGCVAQRMADDLLSSAHGVDFVVGTDQYERLPEAVANAHAGSRSVSTRVVREQTYDARPSPTEASICDFVSVMRGCDNYCSYCIVPYVRGRERSRPLDRVLDETRSLIELGARDVTFIGQNVNSYLDGDVDFAGLLRAANDVPGLARIRFATSHPKDLSDAVIDAVAGLDNVCEHVHLPVQSGSDTILEAMNRSYTRDDYLALVEKLRARVPGVAVTTDVIVGFPGETEEDYRATVSLMDEVRFDSAFMFRYSVRAGTRAAKLTDDVPEEMKLARLESVISLQRSVTEEINRRLVGTVQEVLVEGPSEKDESLLFGKTGTSKVVVFDGQTATVGGLEPVLITEASAWTLRGTHAPGGGKTRAEKDLAGSGGPR